MIPEPSKEILTGGKHSSLNEEMFMVFYKYII